MTHPTTADAGTAPDSTEERAYDAVLLVGFGGPEGPDDVVPFLENVTRGRGIPRERLVEVGAHYAHFGGVSPLNAQNRALRDDLAQALAGRGVGTPVVLGNRNWHPMLAEVLAGLRADGAQRVLAVLTSAYSSYSGCRQYREDLAAAVESAGGGLEVAKVPAYFDRPGFLEPVADAVMAALDSLDPAARDGAALVFTTHSIPVAAAAASGPPGMFDPGAGGAYLAQHRFVADHVVAEVAARTGVAQRRHDLVFQSRSGPPHQPWLEPDVGDHLVALAAEGVPAAVMVPLGFLSDHIEVLWDLDVVAAGQAAEAGIPVARAATPHGDPRFVGLLADLVVEALGGPPAPSSLAPWGPMPARCTAGCCASARGARPALCGQD